MNQKKLFLSGILTVFLSVPSWAANSKPATAPDADQSKKASEGMSETIQGEVKEKLNIQKTPPTIELSIKDIVESGTAQTDHVLQEARPIPSDSDFSFAGSMLNSTQVLKPWNPVIPEPPLISFQTGLSNVAAKRWEFKVSDETGEVVKVISGKGVPPRVIEWNGINERGTYISVGILYSYQFVTYDEHNNANTFPGEPFRLDCFMYKDKGKLVIEFANKKLFKSGENGFDPSMLGFWDRAIDVIREHSNSPITVEMYADSEKSSLAEERRQTAVNSISDATNIPAVDIRHTVNKITNRGDIVRLVMAIR